MEDNIIHADPTKDFFISMLIKDIPLIRAIIDLVDNSIDGARRLRNDREYDGLHVDITLDEEHFKIKDNCGGIPLDVAIDYAFRFGRPPEAELTPHSVGLFGVGMKRAIFKMGNYFRVDSRTDQTCFLVEQDIKEWSKIDEWSFHFEDIEEAKSPLQEPGTVVEITELHESVRERFGLDNFITELTNQLEAAQQIGLENGLRITLNGYELIPQTTQLKSSDQIQPGFSNPVFTKFTDVGVRIYVGILEREPSKAGWYLYCNDRLVLFADKENRTGWGERRGLPRYHNDYAYFRGYVYFNSKDAGLLPWNTTKTGVDDDSELFKAVRLQMMDMMQPVIEFLRSLADERSKFGNDAELQQAIDGAPAKPLSELRISEQRFQSPPYDPDPEPNVSSIQYKVAVERIEHVKERLGVGTNREVGEGTFNYYYALECED